MTLVPDISRSEILEEVAAAERQAMDVLEQAAQLAPDAEERELYRRLAGRELQSLSELYAEKTRLEAEDFVQRALDV